MSALMLTLLTGLGGAFTRMLPELMNWFNKRTDNAHELAMLEKQVQLEKNKLELIRVQGSEERSTNYEKGLMEKELLAERGEQERQTLGLNIDNTQMLALLDAQTKALGDQFKDSGNKWVNALTYLVRPLTTYYFLICYGIVKTAMIVMAVQQAEATAWQSIVSCWSEADGAMLWGILNFWFVGRVIDKCKR